MLKQSFISNDHFGLTESVSWTHFIVCFSQASTTSSLKVLGVGGMNLKQHQKRYFLYYLKIFVIKEVLKTNYKHLFINLFSPIGASAYFIAKNE